MHVQPHVMRMKKIISRKEEKKNNYICNECDWHANMILTCIRMENDDERVGRKGSATGGKMIINKVKREEREIVLQI